MTSSAVCQRFQFVDALLVTPHPRRSAKMNALVTSLLLLLLLCGCSLRPSTARVSSGAQVPPGAPAVVFTDCRREQDPIFSQRERHIVTSTRRYLEQLDKKPVDAYYRVKRTPDQYEVFVIYVAGHTDGQPRFTPGAHCTVLLRDDGTVIRVLPGA